ncbi:MAG: leucine-rich repeat domain-containing protein [Promethearchaeota archaeon]
MVHEYNSVKLEDSDYKFIKDLESATGASLTLVNVANDPESNWSRETILVEGGRIVFFSDAQIRDYSHVPESVAGLAGLKRLVLKHPNLSRLPGNLGEIKSLVEIHVENTRVSDLPRGIGDLPVLEKLACIASKITAIPEAVCRLPSLKFLDVSNSAGLETLPPCIGGLSSLEFLKVLGTKIYELPASILELESLKEVGISEIQYKKMRKKSKKVFNELIGKCDVLVLNE